MFLREGEMVLSCVMHNILYCIRMCLVHVGVYCVLQCACIQQHADWTRTVRRAEARAAIGPQGWRALCPRTHRLMVNSRHIPISLFLIMHVDDDIMTPQHLVKCVNK